MSTQKSIEERVEEVFPVGKKNGEIVKRDVGSDIPPSFREKQKEATIALCKYMMDDEVDVVLLNAPTGAGKSLIIYTAAKATPGWNIITTPLNTLVDQLDNDKFIQDNVITIKGRNNYDCIHPEDAGTSVDEAICQRDSNFECDVKDQCPYYGRKARAIEHPNPVTNMSYLMAESMLPDEVDNTLGVRAKEFIDECQNIEDFGLDYIQFTVSDRTVPDEVWKNITIPPERKEDDMEHLVEWLSDEVLGAVDELSHQLDAISLKSKEQTHKHEQLQRFRTRVENFLDDVENNEWVAEMDTNFRKNRKNTRKIVFKPLYIGRFLDNLLWKRGDTVVLSSATIPGGGWLDEIGLSDANVRKVSVGSTFPVENRRIICNLDVGKMVSEYSDENDNRKENAWPMAKRIMNLALHHEGEKGFVHCRSYSIAKLLRRQYMNHDEVTIDGETYNPAKWFRNNVMVQDRSAREESLQEWIDGDTQVFFSVAMDEGVDLDGGKCRWQVLAKTLYPYMTKRMKKRKEVAYENGNKQEFWEYYNRKAVIQLQQAYGRGVRSKDDYCVFYILDSSAVQSQGLIQINAEMFNEWFLEAIEGINVNPKRGM